MRLLLFSDLHRDRQATERIVDQSRDVDLVIGAGDFATTRRGIEDVVPLLAKITQPSVLVPGNSESYEELVAACRDWPSAIVLHGSGTVAGGVPIWGVGGAIPVTPFGSWSYDFTEEEAAELLAGCSTGGILVSHSPPRGLVDRSSRGENLGSHAVREVIDQTAPRLVVCGHIHESAGQQAELNATTIVNAGPRGVLYEF